MTALARLIPVVAVLLVALGHGDPSAGSARAGENCLAAPNAQSPPGSHWHYRTDPVKQSKCWYLRTDDQAIQTPIAQEKPATSVAAKWPAAAISRTAPDATETKAQELRPAWPDPPLSNGADNMVWPEPPSAGGATRGVAAENTHKESASQMPGAPAMAVSSDKYAGSDAGADKQVAAPIEMAVSHGAMPSGMLLAFAIGIAIAGLFARRIVRKTFARRHTVDPDRREPASTTSIGSGRRIPRSVAYDVDLASEWGENDRLDGESKDTLRKLLRVLDQQAA